MQSNFRFSYQLWYRMNESRGKSGKSLKRSVRRLCKKRQMRDERDGSEVYDVRKEKSVMGVCLHYPLRGVNKYMHKRDIDARWWEIGWTKGENFEPRLCTRRCRLVHKLPKTVEEKEWVEFGTCRVFKAYQRPIVIVIFINSRYSHLQES